jgi:hypothetical protein
MEELIPLTPKERSLANLIPAKKGEIRNKNGKPPGTLNSKTLLHRLLKAKGEYTDPAGKKWRLPKITIMHEKQIELAMSGNTSAYNAVIDRFEGRAEQKQQIAFEEGAAQITVRIGKAE